jgi:hypothetical protein
MKFKKYKVTFQDILQATDYKDAYDQLRRSFLTWVNKDGWMHDVTPFEVKEYKGTMIGNADRYETKDIIRILHRQNRPIPDELIKEEE